jgi:hypothetical protein
MAYYEQGRREVTAHEANIGFQKRPQRPTTYRRDQHFRAALHDRLKLFEPHAIAGAVSLAR